MPGGTLFSHIRKLGNFTESLSRFYLAEIILGLEALHNSEVIYKDLKPENILFDNLGHIKLSDFNLSNVKRKGTSFSGTYEYMAPELITNREYTKAVDFWSLGIVLYEMLVGTTPFYSLNFIRLYSNILKG